MKTYGKEPESLASITAVMLSDLAEFAPEKIMQAFKTHAQRNEEFPTTANLVSLIRRNGKPSLRESDIIAIRKKDGEDRTSAEWAMLKDWDEQQQEGWRDIADAQKDMATLQENLRLRQEVKQLTEEVRRLGDLLTEIRRSQGIERPESTLTDKVQNTIAAMRSSGASEEEIAAFSKQYGIAA